MTTAHRYPPTPWISQVNPVTQDHYKFRISHVRNNGQLTVTLAKDSPTSPNEVRSVKPSKPGWWPFVQACQRLLNLAQWDPDVNPDGPAARSQWNKNKKDYAVMSNDVDVLVGLLPQLLTGTSRASLKKTLQTSLLASTVNSTDVRHVASRTHRFTEVMNATHKALTFLTPAHERMQDARRMKGYSKEEVESMSHCLSEAIRALQTTQRIARTGNAPFNQIYKSGIMPQTKPTATEKFEVDLSSFDAEESPLSPAEQAIAQAQQHNHQSDFQIGEKDVTQMTEDERDVWERAIWEQAKAAMKPNPEVQPAKPKGGFTITPEDK